MKRNIKAKVTKLYDRDTSECFVVRPWGKVLNARTSQMFFAKWYNFVNGGWNTELVEYLIAEWLPCKCKWAFCDMNKVFHLGNTSTNRVESMHSSLKTWPHTSVNKVINFFVHTIDLCWGQVMEIRKLLEDA